jgi:hypothetical protein
VEASTIKYSVDLRIRAAGATVMTGALVTRLKMTKLFLGFDWLRAINPAIDCVTGEVKTEEVKIPLQMRVITEETPNYEEEFPMVFSEQDFRELPP